MHSGVKLIIGIIIFLIGLYWYLAPVFGNTAIQYSVVPQDVADSGISTFESFRIVFSGLFGLALILVGLLIAWIEYEDLKWERREKAGKK